MSGVLRLALTRSVTVLRGLRAAVADTEARFRPLPTAAGASRRRVLPVRGGGADRQKWCDLHFSYYSSWLTTSPQWGL